MEQMMNENEQQLGNCNAEVQQNAGLIVPEVEARIQQCGHQLGALAQMLTLTAYLYGGWINVAATLLQRQEGTEKSEENIIGQWICENCRIVFQEAQSHLAFYRRFNSPVRCFLWHKQRANTPRNTNSTQHDQDMDEDAEQSKEAAISTSGSHCDANPGNGFQKSTFQFGTSLEDCSKNIKECERIFHDISRHLITVSFLLGGWLCHVFESLGKSSTCESETRLKFSRWVRSKLALSEDDVWQLIMYHHTVAMQSAAGTVGSLAETSTPPVMPAASCRSSDSEVSFEPTTQLMTSATKDKSSETSLSSQHETELLSKSRLNAETTVSENVETPVKYDEPEISFHCRFNNEPPTPSETSDEILITTHLDDPKRYDNPKLLDFECDTRPHTPFGISAETAMCRNAGEQIKYAPELSELLNFESDSELLSEIVAGSAMRQTVEEPMNGEAEVVTIESDTDSPTPNGMGGDTSMSQSVAEPLTIHDVQELYFKYDTEILAQNEVNADTLMKFHEEVYVEYDEPEVSYDGLEVIHDRSE